MSIWCSDDHIGYDPWFGEPEPQGGHVLSYAEGFSNHYPDLTGSHERPATIGLAWIAPWCTPGHDEQCEPCDTQHDYPDAGGWLRLEVAANDALDFWHKPPEVASVGATVVLDREAALSLAKQLTEWAERPLLSPIEDPRG